MSLPQPTSFLHQNSVRQQPHAPAGGAGWQPHRPPHPPAAYAYGQHIHRNMGWLGHPNGPPFRYPPPPPPPRPRHHRCEAVRGDGAARTAGGEALQPGMLAAFTKDGRTELGLVLGPDGKKNWWLENQAGRRTSLPPKSVVLVLPGAGYTPDSLAAFAAAAAAADATLLELAWSIAAEEQQQGGEGTGGPGAGGPGPSFDLAQLAQLLFDSQAPQELYTTFALLLADGIYFRSSYKSGRWAFQPRAAADVEAAAAAAAAEAAAAEEAAAFARDLGAAVAAAAGARPASVAAQRQQWLAGPHGQRVQALLDFALQAPDRVGDKPASEALARFTLALLKRRAEPDVAASILQEAGLLRLHEPLPVLRLGRTAEGDFPPKLQAAAEALLSSPPPDPDASSRLDLTHLAVYTIDDASTTEVDDGLSVTRGDDGELLLWVHVADPTAMLRPGDVLDLEARARSRTLYFPFGAVPMFPRCLAEGPFSLSSSSSSSSSSDGGACNALSVCMALEEDGALGALVKVAPSRIRVGHRLTYDQADADLGLGPGMCAHEDLQLLFEAARLRRAWRVAQGCIDIDSFEAKLEVRLDQLDTPNPAVTCTRLSQWESAARTLVAEAMIAAGEAVGRLGAAAGLPLPYRCQDAPRLPPAEALAPLPEGPCRGFALRRCMTRSGVGPTPARHASLGLDAYVQVTSPIRRYTDVVAHFNLKAHLRGEEPPFSSADIAAIADAAAAGGKELGRAEGEVERYWAAEYLRQHEARRQQRLRRRRLAQPQQPEQQPEQPEQQQQQELDGLPAMVLGWARPDLNLAAVTLEDMGLETVIKVEFPVEPGERLLLQLVEADPRSGFFRFAVTERLDVRGAELEDKEATQDSSSSSSSEGETHEEDGDDFEGGTSEGPEAAAAAAAQSDALLGQPERTVRWREAAAAAE